MAHMQFIFMSSCNYCTLTATWLMACNLSTFTCKTSDSQTLLSDNIIKRFKNKWVI